MKPTKETLHERIDRLMVMVPWIIAQDGPLISEVTEKFNINEDQLRADIELLFVCGVYPFTPDALIEADIFDDRVYIRSAFQFENSPALTPTESVSLLSAAVVALKLNESANEYLVSGAKKLAKAVGVGDPFDAIEVELAVPEFLTVAKTAFANRQIVEMDYYSNHRNESSKRKVALSNVFSNKGFWYLEGIDQKLGEMRTFRMDRIDNLVMTDDHYELPDEPELEVSCPHMVRSITIFVPNEFRWIIETIECELLSVREDGLVVEVGFSAESWLQRFLLATAGEISVLKDAYSASDVTDLVEAIKKLYAN